MDALDDRHAELDIVTLQNALFGDHQFLHIASHGVFEPDRPGRTGAVLSSTSMLTVDHVREFARVPDVVFLNCCSLGRIGMSRMAAGLAREFMAIGTRAVVAAGWSVDDVAARAFAVTFYRELLGGRPLGDAVARARLACAQAGRGQTWAAYQCYGDPGFVVRGHRATIDLAGPDPVSDTDLIARLDTLAIRTGDLGLAGRGPVSDGRSRLSGMWEALRSWVADHPAVDDESVRRRLAAIARDLGDFRAAATLFGRLVLEPGGDAIRIGLLSRSATPADLQQAANCLARAAQREARLPGHDLQAALADLDLATRIARAGVGVLPEGESYAMLGSVLRRRATVDTANRQQLLEEARDAYARGATAGATDGPYVRENARQLSLLLGDASLAHDRPGEDLDAVDEAGAGERARRPAAATGRRLLGARAAGRPCRQRAARRAGRRAAGAPPGPM